METKINTENRLATMEAKIDSIKEDFNEIKSDVKEIASDVKDHIRWEAEKYEKLDQKYSGKWVEKLTIAIAGGLVVAIGAGIVLYFVNN